ncbi:MAG: glycosyl hydrolase family 43 [Armatimonadota bacterium]
MFVLPLIGPPATFTNPIGMGADPSITYDGTRYALTYTTGNDVRVATSPTLAGLHAAPMNVVYTPPKETMYWRNLWAPEFFADRGQTYILFAADDGRDENHRLYLLRSKSKDVRGPYEFLGKVPTPASTWAIDGFYFRHAGRLYLLWSGRVQMSDPQRIYIVEMRDTLTPMGRGVAITEPTFDWERVGWPVNEGPTAVAKGRAVTVTYAASGGTTMAYCLGRLFNPTGDLMNPKAWEKSPAPVFAGSHGMFAPGHNSFFRAKGGAWWSVFHAKRTAEDGWGGRITAAQPVTFDHRGQAILGTPAGWDHPFPEPR